MKNKTNLYGCAICPKTFSVANALIKHIEDHKLSEKTSSGTKIKNEHTDFNEVNQKIVATKKNDRTGYKSNNFKAQNKRGTSNSCGYCNKNLQSKYHLKRHERVHTGERPFSCKYCDKKFQHKKGAEDHETLHTGVRPFCCKYCSKSFTRPSTLNQHERIHTGEKPYSCKYCQKKFNTQTYIKRHHQKICTGEMKYNYRIEKNNYEIPQNKEDRYSCKNCVKKFKYYCLLKKHEKIHDRRANKPFSCQYCNKKFSTRNYVKIHEKVHSTENSTKP